MQSIQRQLLYVLLIAGTAVADTTNDLLDGQWTVTGSVLDHTCDGCYLNGHVHTDWQGGAITQTIDLSSYLNQSELNYFTSVTACENQIGGHCSSGNLDTFTVNLTLDNGESWTDTFYVGNQWQDIDLSYTPTSDAGSAELSVYGVDNGFWAGWYGPLYYAGEFTATYDPNYVPPEPEPIVVPAVEDPVVLTSVLDSVIMPDPVMSLPEVEIPVVEVAPVVEVSVDPVASPEPVESSPEPTTTEVASSTESSAGADTGASEGTSDSGGGQKDSGGGGKQSSSQTAIAAVMADIDVSTASMETIGGIAGDPASPVAQILALAIMAANGAEIEDVKLDEPELPKTINIKDNKNLADRFWLNRLASDAKFDKYMVEAQWK